MKTGLIGLGAMGTGMAIRLSEAGYLAGLYNRTASKAQKLAHDLNAVAYREPGALAAEVDLILICVSADQDVLAMADAVAQTAKPGSTVIDMSTVSSETAKAAAKMLAEKQVAFLDAPVSGGVEGAHKGSLSIMVGGDAAILERARPVLATLGSRITHMGATGSGQATKASNQIMAAGINQAVTEALAFAQAQGLPMGNVIDVISGGAAGNWFLQHRGNSMIDGQFTPGFKVALHHKDLKICLAMAAQSGIAIPISAMTLADYAELMQSGHGDDDISALLRLRPKK